MTVREFKEKIASIPSEYDDEALGYIDVGGGPAEDIRFVPARPDIRESAHIDDLA